MQRPGGVGFLRGARSDHEQVSDPRDRRVRPADLMAKDGSEPMSWNNPKPLRAEVKWLENEHQKSRPEVASSKKGARMIHDSAIPDTATAKPGEPLRGSRGPFCPPPLHTGFENSVSVAWTEENDPWKRAEPLKTLKHAEGTDTGRFDSWAKYSTSKGQNDAVQAPALMGVGLPPMGEPKIKPPVDGDGDGGDRSA